MLSFCNKFIAELYYKTITINQLFFIAKSIFVKKYYLMEMQEQKKSPLKHLLAKRLSQFFFYYKIYIYTYIFIQSLREEYKLGNLYVTTPCGNFGSSFGCGNI